jgi:hypothetical protein
VLERSKAGEVGGQFQQLCFHALCSFFIGENMRHEERLAFYLRIVANLTEKGLEKSLLLNF